MSNNGTNSGATPAPGTINIVTKRATDTPVNRYTQTFSGRGNAGEFIDVGRRFGEKNEWGIRVNAEYMEGGLALPGAEKNEKNIFINMDHRGDNSTTNLLAGYFDLRVMVVKDGSLYQIAIAVPFYLMLLIQKITMILMVRPNMYMAI